MREYFLVIDTETSGLPKKWDAPYSSNNNWPYILQIAWLIYDADGALVKKENHYVKPGNFKISKASLKIHHITKEDLLHKGKDKLAIIKRLANDIVKYQPLVVAHFTELDYHMVGVESFRLNIENPLLHKPLFCTMKASVPYIKNPNFKHLKLNVFYKTLFNKKPEKLHNALSDATITSEIFFYLKNKGEVSDSIIAKQQITTKTEFKKPDSFFKWFLSIFKIIIFFILIWYNYGK
ncbi:exonuclease domain-containing protein [Pedobacter alpinus]|uniref:Exonuclease domain-containing protein n=1 Tax=Pedobacter alpinus TaxID=1590643 RepID=A0ABW5TLI3_9SPHI